MTNKASSLEQMPEYLSTQHLIALGIYSSVDAAYQARINGYSPDYIKIRRKILYDKKAVIEFLERKKNLGNAYRQNSADNIDLQENK